MTFFGLKIGFSKAEPVPAGVVARPSYLTTGPVRLAAVAPMRMGFIKYLIEVGAIHD